MIDKVWVIGASSFTGQYLMPQLIQAGYQTDSTSVDLTNAQQVEQAILHIQPDYIINLAAISFVPDGANAEIYALNTFGAQNILDACLKLPQAPKRIILVSSSQVYGQQNNEVLDENCIVNPINHYGCSKWAMEQIAKTYRDKLAITITRPFNYTGKEQAEKFLIPKIIQHFQQKSSTIKLGNIDIWRDFSDVRWIVQVYTALLSDPASELSIVNLCSGKLTSIREIIQQLQKETGHTIRIETDQRFVRATDIVSQRGSSQHLMRIMPGLHPIPLSQTLTWMMS